MKLTNTLDAQSNRIIGLAEPTGAQDAATKNYVDAAAQGYKWKEPVRVSSTANLTLSGAQTVDGVALVAGDRVLVRAQTTATQNGIYTAAAGAWVRATDFDANSEVVGASLFVSEGASLGNSVWVMTTDGPVTLGTSPLVFTQTNAGTTYSAGVGISISGNTIAVDTAVTARKVAATIGDGTSTTLTVRHNLATQDVMVSVRQTSSNEVVIADVVNNTINTVQITFSVAPAAGQFRVLVIG